MNFFFTIKEVEEVYMKLLNNQVQQNINIASALTNIIIHGDSEDVSIDICSGTNFIKFSVALGLSIFSEALPPRITSV